MIASGIFNIDEASPLDSEPRCNFILFAFRKDLDLCNRSDRSQSLASKAERNYGGKILERADLRCRMSLDGKHCVVPRHAFPVIDNADQATAAKFDINVYLPCTGVN